MTFIFDLDGTLIDTPRGISESVRAVLGSVATPSDEQIASLIGKPLEVMFATLAGSSADTNYFIQRFRADFAERVVPHAADLVFPGVVSMLSALREEGWCLAVATSKITPSAIEILDRANVLSYFDVVAGADAVSRPKPAPDLAVHVAARLQTPPANCVVIGDSVHDIGMGISAGMRTVGVGWGVDTAASLLGAGAKVVVHDISSLAAVLAAPRHRIEGSEQND